MMWRRASPWVGCQHGTSGLKARDISVSTGEHAPHSAKLTIQVVNCDINVGDDGIAINACEGGAGDINGVFIDNWAGGPHAL